MSGDEGGAILTLEPLMEAVQAGVEAAGWTLSGLQKTTSYQFEGRWEGDATRSAYLFFHHPTGPDWASIDVYLDETTRGLTGNLALVVDTKDLGGLGDVTTALSALGELWDQGLPEGYRTPLTLRLRRRRGEDPRRAEGEVRFKVGIPPAPVRAGAADVTALARGVVSTFEGILSDSRLAAFIDGA